MSESELILIGIAGVGGFIAGITTTLAGVGGGIAMVAMLSMVLPPQTVIPLTSPVLLLGNISRVAFYRHDIDRPVVGWFIAGAIPAAIGGAFLLPEIPERWLETILAAVVLLFVIFQAVGGKERFNISRYLPPRAFAFVGAGNGFISAVAGGGGPVSAPFLYAHGLTKENFVGTSSAGAFSINGLKSIIFSATGLLTLSHLPASIAAAVMIVLGNALGRVFLARISERLFRRFLLGALSVIAVRLLL